MKFIARIACCILVTSCFIYSCKKDTPTDPITPTPPVTPINPYDVYIAGLLGDSAVVWKNEIVTVLSKKGYAYSVYVVGSDVYVAGASNDSAMIWKNGIATNLGKGVANSVFVSSTDIYVAGKLGNAAIIWKNNIPTTLSSSGTCRSVFVKGTDVYVAGNDLSGNGVYWKNNNAYLILGPLGTTAAPSSIYISGSDVYVAGPLYSNSVPQAAYWKNGTLISLPFPGSSFNRSLVNSLFVNGSDVYVSGESYLSSSSSFDGRATVWKNGSVIDLSNGMLSTAGSTFVLGADIFTTGYMAPGNMILWKNNIPVTTVRGSGRSIFVVSH